VFVGNARRLVMLRRLAPALAERRVARKVEHDHFQDRSSPRSEGNLFAPMRAGTDVSGGWQPPRTSFATFVVGSLAVLGLGALAWTWLADETPFAAGSGSGALVARGRRGLQNAVA